MYILLNQLKKMQEFWFSICQDAKVKVTFHVAKCGNPYSELVLCIYPIQSARTQTQQWTHTRSSGQPFYNPCRTWDSN